MDLLVGRCRWIAVDLSLASSHQDREIEQKISAEETDLLLFEGGSE